MNAAADRLEFAPPPQPGMLRAFMLAVVAHLLLLAALTWGVRWKNDTRELSAEAELWSSVPVQAAPKLVEAPPAPPPPPKVQPAPAPPPLPREADIALEREKQKQAEAKKKQDELERQKRLQAEKLEAQKKQELARKAAEDQKKQDAALKAREQEEAKRLEAQRQENLKRMAGLAGATGGPTATGTAQRSAGPSDSYGGRIRGRVKPNIVFTDDIPGNPVAEVEVRAAPDGTIVGVKIIKSSGTKSWDDAVVKALHKTEVLPRDIDGRVPSPIVISFRPKD